MEAIFEYSPEKNALLKEERGISFEEVISAIEQGHLLDIIQHPNKSKYGHQKIYVVDVNSYVYLVPFVNSERGFFLKTIFPSRKLTKRYMSTESVGGDEND